MEILYLIHKKIKQESLSSDEENFFSDWISNPANEKEFQYYKKIWSVTANSKVLTPVVDEQWVKFETTMEQKPGNKTKKLYYLSVAAAAIVIAIGIFALFQPFNNSPEIYISNKTPLLINLPDGTEVNLNVNSRLEVPKSFNSNSRTIYLKGEGLFDVYKNQDAPFVINTDNNLSVRVLGTKFNFRSYADENKSELRVLEGKVQFKSQDEKVILVKNEEIDFINNINAFTEKRDLNSNHLAWFTKKFEFNNEPINDAVESLERYLDKTIQLPENSHDLRYTGSFKNPTSNDIAEVISLAMGWKYNITSEAIVFTASKKSINQ